MVRSVVGRARRLPLRSWPGVVRTVLLVVGVEIGLRTLRLPRLAGRLGVGLAQDGDVGRDGEAGAFEMTARERRRVEDVRRVLSVPGIDGTCLRQSLLVGHALRAHGPRLALGVTKRDGQVAAHAWVEVDGWVIDDLKVYRRPPGRFVRLAPGEG